MPNLTSISQLHICLLQVKAFCHDRCLAMWYIIRRVVPYHLRHDRASGCVLTRVSVYPPPPHRSTLVPGHSPRTHDGFLRLITHCQPGPYGIGTVGGRIRSP